MKVTQTGKIEVVMEPAGTERSPDLSVQPIGFIFQEMSDEPEYQIDMESIGGQ